ERSVASVCRRVTAATRIQRGAARLKPRLTGDPQHLLRARRMGVNGLTDRRRDLESVAEDGAGEQAGARFAIGRAGRGCVPDDAEEGLAGLLVLRRAGAVEEREPLIDCRERGGGHALMQLHLRELNAGLEPTEGAVA